LEELVGEWHRKEAGVEEDETMDAVFISLQALNVLAEALLLTPFNQFSKCAF
jgi:hypothetical protein